MNVMYIVSYLNILSLGSYDVLIGIELLQAYKEILDCFNKTCFCTYEDGNPRIIIGMHKTIFIRQISTL